MPSRRAGSSTSSASERACSAWPTGCSARWSTPRTTLGFLVVLDRLGPVERAVYVLADVCGARPSASSSTPTSSARCASLSGRDGVGEGRSGRDEEDVGDVEGGHVSSTEGRTARIVVGVDGSDGAAAALRWAVEEAELRQAALDAVTAWHIPYAAGSPAIGLVIDPEEERAYAAEQLEEVIGTLGARPRVQVNRVVVEGGAARALIEAASGADLLVVGSRGRGGFKGLLLGSVSQQCIHHAPCPVVVVRP
jgi:nucleotide-binding universal stress UspA family protein